MNQCAAYEIERLIRFGLQQGLVGKLDAVVARNTLLDLFGLPEPYEGEVPDEALDTPSAILEPLLDLAGEQGLYDKDVNALRVNFEARLMGRADAARERGLRPL